MEDKAPNACGFCVNFIETKFTQPCAFRIHTLHDFSRREYCTWKAHESSCTRTAWPSLIPMYETKLFGQTTRSAKT